MKKEYTLSNFASEVIGAIKRNPTDKGSQEAAGIIRRFLDIYSGGDLVTVGR